MLRGARSKYIWVPAAASAGGKAVMFQRNASGPPSVIRLTKFPRLPLLLVDTQQSRYTAVKVEKVKPLKTNYPRITEMILDGIARLATSVFELISSADFRGAWMLSDAWEILLASTTGSWFR